MTHFLSPKYSLKILLARAKSSTAVKNKIWPYTIAYMHGSSTYPMTPRTILTKLYELLTDSHDILMAPSQREMDAEVNNIYVFSRCKLRTTERQKDGEKVLLATKYAMQWNTNLKSQAFICSYWYCRIPGRLIEASMTSEAHPVQHLIKNSALLKGKLSVLFNGTRTQHLKVLCSCPFL